ncbi:hypothetical protein OY671_011294, partial [Metschnikowia pulcherrima]
GARLYGAAAYGVFSSAVAVVESMVPVASLGSKRMIFPWSEEEANTGAADARPATHVSLDASSSTVSSGLGIAGVVALGAQVSPAAMVSDHLRFASAVSAPAVSGQAAGDVASAATRWTHMMRYEVMARGVIEPYVATAVTFAA